MLGTFSVLAGSFVMLGGYGYEKTVSDLYLVSVMALAMVSVLFYRIIRERLACRIPSVSSVPGGSLTCGNPVVAVE